MKNLTLLTCSYNTPLVTANMLKTFLHIHPGCKVLVSENSTNNDTVNIIEEAKIPYIRNYGGLHGPSVDVLFKVCTTRYALLVDTDIIFLQEHSSVFEQFKANDITLMGEIVGDRGGKKLYPRVNPWHCFIDLEKVKNHNINFFDLHKKQASTDRIYDVGSTFFEDVKANKLRIADYNGNNYLYKHYEGMSWRVNKYGSVDGDIDIDNNATHSSKALYDYGKQILNMYIQETKHLTDLKLVYND